MSRIDETCDYCGAPILGDGTEERDWSDFCSSECDALAAAEENEDPW